MSFFFLKETGLDKAVGSSRQCLGVSPHLTQTNVEEFHVVLS